MATESAPVVRRNRPGIKAKDMYSWPDQDFSDMESIMAGELDVITFPCVIQVDGPSDSSPSISLTLRSAIHPTVDSKRPKERRRHFGDAPGTRRSLVEIRTP